MIESPVYDMILEEGIEKGRLEGMQQGELRKALQTARNMLAEKAVLSFVLRVTGLSEQQLRENGVRGSGSP